METLELFERLGIALAVGLLVGLERGWHERDEAEGERSFGMRTFALCGLLGGIWGALSLTSGVYGGLVLAIAFLAFAGVTLVFRLREVQRDGTLGATTMIAVLAVFGLGALAVLGNKSAAAAAGVTVAGLLALKQTLHAGLRSMTWPELRATLVLLAMTLVALPLLPDAGYGPTGAFNPRAIWLLTILIAATSFAGYVAVRIMGQRAGIAFAGLAGGLVSSTVVTVTMAGRAREHAAQARLLMAGAVLAGGVSFLRVLVFTGLLNREVLAAIAWPIGFAGTAMFAVAAWLLWRRQGAADSAEPAELALSNPLDWQSIGVSAALLVTIMAVSGWASAYTGSAGLLVVSAVSGIADVDAITLALAQQAAHGLSPSVAATGIMIAVGVNSISKIVMAFSTGGTGPGRILLGATALAATAALAGAALAFFFGPLSFPNMR